MKQSFLFFLWSIMLATGYSQGIQLLFKGGSNGGWNDAANWIQIGIPAGQLPLQRAPTALDDVVFSKSLSGLATAGFYGNFGEPDSIIVGGTGTGPLRCRSMKVSEMELSFANFSYNYTVHVYTNNGGGVLVDSGANIRWGHFMLHGGDPERIDLEINNSNFGSLFSHEDWSAIRLDHKGKARFVNSTIGGMFLGFGGGAGSDLYAENCQFSTSSFVLADSATATILNCTLRNDINNVFLRFHIGKGANFVSQNFNITSMSLLDFCTSGSVLNGNVEVLYETSGGTDFTQQDAAHPLPNIINGNFKCQVGTLGISGDLKISGNFVNGGIEPLIYPDTSHIFVNGQDVFKMGGITNYGNNAAITTCVSNYCHFKLEFFGNTNSNINWPIGFPIDTLVVNKTNCAKLTSFNSLYVSGAAIIQNGQLALYPNDSIPYKFVCAGDLKILPGGGLLLRKNAAGIAANMAIQGSLTDLNTVADSTCTGLSNPYKGSVTFYSGAQHAGNKIITVMNTSSIGNLYLIGAIGTQFILGHDLQINDLHLTNLPQLDLGTYTLAVTGDIFSH